MGLVNGVIVAKGKINRHHHTGEQQIVRGLAYIVRTAGGGDPGILCRFRQFGFSRRSPDRMVWSDVFRFIGRDAEVHEPLDDTRLP